MTAAKCDPRIQHQLERREESREQREERWAASEKHGAGIIGEMVRAPPPYKGTNFRHHSAVTRYSMAKAFPEHVYKLHLDFWRLRSSVRGALCEMNCGERRGKRAEREERRGKKAEIMREESREEREERRENRSDSRLMREHSV